jgi:hypothetical protein
MVQVVSPAAHGSGAWHRATATYSPATGMRLHVDGAQVGSAVWVLNATRAHQAWAVDT